MLQYTYNVSIDVKADCTNALPVLTELIQLFSRGKVECSGSSVFATCGDKFPAMIQGNCSLVKPVSQWTFDIVWDHFHSMGISNIPRTGRLLWNQKQISLKPQVWTHGRSWETFAPNIARCGDLRSAIFSPFQNINILVNATDNIRFLQEILHHHIRSWDPYSTGVMTFALP